MAIFYIVKHVFFSVEFDEESVAVAPTIVSVHTACCLLLTRTSYMSETRKEKL
jgi:hypothetical protein